MKPIKIDGKLLLAALDLVGAGFGSSTLTRITIKSESDGLGDCNVELWDNETMARTSFPFSGNSVDLSLLVPSAQIDALLTRTNTDELSIQEKEKAFNLKAKSTRLSVPKIDESTLSQWSPGKEQPAQIEISRGLLLGTLAAPIEDILGTPTAIRGFQMTAKDGQVSLLATDGFRVYRAVFKNDGIIKAEDSETVFPIRILKFLKRLETSDLPLSIGIRDGSYLVRAGLGDLTLEVYGSNLAVKYPEIQMLLDDSPDHRYLISTARLKAEVELHQSLAKEDKVAVGTFEFKDDTLEIETRGTSQINSVIYDDEYKVLEQEKNVKIGIRLKYLGDAIKYIDVLERGRAGKVELGISVKGRGLVWIQPSEETRKAHPDVEIISIIAPVNA